MPRDLSRSRSPSRRRRSPSPIGHRVNSRRSRRDRSRSPYSSYSRSSWEYKDGHIVFWQIVSSPSYGKLAGDGCPFVARLCASSCDKRWSTQRRKSRSVSPRRRRSRSLTARRRRSRSRSPRHHKRPRSQSSSISPVHKSSSPSLGSIERKNASEKMKKQEEEKKRRQQEAELKLLEEETAKRVEEAIRRKVEEKLNSEEIRLEIQRRLEEGRKKLLDDVAVLLEKEKEAALLEARQKEEQARKEKEELERMLEENRRRVEEAQEREALEQQRREEERYRELEEIQRQKERRCGGRSKRRSKNG
ncbi:hypothetical protein G4B88_002304 [Cannabis sativa]|uniref:Uncharacterized protein n=1 Tax=Cannabis sativa TaxID=3483 RepID=A0A7J6EUY3_CANSA|nr:hypothetical protein G4B88_002304 [Cannabis sativa]